MDALPASAAGAMLVMKSTVPAGTAGRCATRSTSAGWLDIAYASNPEFLREGRRCATSPSRTAW